jgi:hypothetical protein
MILEVSRGHIKVEIFGKTITVPGEMFFPPNEKMGFAIFVDKISCWDKPDDSIKLTNEEIDAVIAEIKKDFKKGGHTLEVE